MASVDGTGRLLSMVLQNKTNKKNKKQIQKLNYKFSQNHFHFVFNVVLIDADVHFIICVQFSLFIKLIIKAFVLNL